MHILITIHVVQLQKLIYHGHIGIFYESDQTQLYKELYLYQYNHYMISVDTKAYFYSKQGKESHRKSEVKHTLVQALFT